jgi:hypothetical protein
VPVGTIPGTVEVASYLGYLADSKLVKFCSHYQLNAEMTEVLLHVKSNAL